uniref:Transposase n=1 Tax=Globodera pallida TaxID=36090 RepID=A0A183CKE6_GLOPA
MPNFTFKPFKTKRVKLGKIDSIIARQRKSAPAASNKTGDDHPHDDDQQAAETAGMSIHPQRPGRDDEWHRLYTQLMRKPAHKGRSASKEFVLILLNYLV